MDINMVIMEFINQFLSAIFDQGTNDDKIEKLRILFAYSKRNIDLDSEYRIMIKSRVK